MKRHCLLLLVSSLASCADCQEYYREQILPMDIKAVVVKKYNDSLNHTYPMIGIRQPTGDSEFTLYFYDRSHLWDSLLVGDSLRKEAGTMEFYRTRAGRRTLFEVSCE
ncbi:hypothetical protein [Hymenobacter canadensis]|uniref:Uncharacterized protein n=1 Tax=Hymenobacter canadensis TaxID=2999067 RepID=A0ABY7LNA7_9BACT|nr:hypothetical protein [Hymenobacter canadensis]WBA40675.1 hypothetical protein O3303_12675 [Hymenobacter canadensis]